MSENPHALRIAILRWAAAKFKADAADYERWRASTKPGAGGTIALDIRLAAEDLEQQAEELEAASRPAAVESVSILDELPPPWTVLLDLRVWPAAILLDKPPEVRDQIRRVLRTAGDRLGALLTEGK